MWNFLKGTVTGISSLIYPAQCIGCRRSETILCAECNRNWLLEPSLIQRNPFPIYAVAPYDKVVSRIVLIAKEEANTFAQELLARAIVKSLTTISGLTNQEFALVPIPSRKSSIRRRGEKFLIPILKKAVTELNSESDNRFSIADILNLHRKVKEQSGLNAKERLANMNKAHHVVLPPAVERELRDKALIIIDDVVTTGSTMASAFSALKERNLTVIAGVGACASPIRLLIR